MMGTCKYCGKDIANIPDNATDDEITCDRCYYRNDITMNAVKEQEHIRKNGMSYAFTQAYGKTHSLYLDTEAKFRSEFENRFFAKEQSPLETYDKINKIVHDITEKKYKSYVLDSFGALPDYTVEQVCPKCNKKDGYTEQIDDILWECYDCGATFEPEKNTNSAVEGTVKRDPRCRCSKECHYCNGDCHTCMDDPEDLPI